MSWENFFSRSTQKPEQHWKREELESLSSWVMFTPSSRVSGTIWQMVPLVVEQEVGGLRLM